MTVFSDEYLFEFYRLLYLIMFYFKLISLSAGWQRTKNTWTQQAINRSLSYNIINEQIG